MVLSTFEVPQNEIKLFPKGEGHKTSKDLVEVALIFTRSPSRVSARENGVNECVFGSKEKSAACLSQANGFPSIDSSAF